MKKCVKFQNNKSTVKLFLVTFLKSLSLSFWLTFKNGTKPSNRYAGIHMTGKFLRLVYIGWLVSLARTWTNMRANKRISTACYAPRGFENGFVNLIVCLATGDRFLSSKTICKIMKLDCEDISKTRYMVIIWDYVLNFQT